MELDSKLSDSMACYSNVFRIIIIVKIVTIFNSVVVWYIIIKVLGNHLLLCKGIIFHN
jgi:hypothetical protein